MPFDSNFNISERMSCFRIISDRIGFLTIMKNFMPPKRRTAKKNIITLKRNKFTTFPFQNKRNLCQIQHKDKFC